MNDQNFKKKKGNFADGNDRKGAPFFNTMAHEDNLITSPRKIVYF